MKKPPCYGCETRYDLCHSSCGEYKEWCAEREKEKTYQRAAMEENGLRTLSYTVASAQRRKKKRRK